MPDWTRRLLRSPRHVKKSSVKRKADSPLPESDTAKVPKNEHKTIVINQDNREALQKLAGKLRKKDEDYDEGCSDFQRTLRKARYQLKRMALRTRNQLNHLLEELGEGGHINDEEMLPAEASVSEIVTYHEATLSRVQSLTIDVPPEVDADDVSLSNK